MPFFFVFFVVKMHSACIVFLYKFSALFLLFICMKLLTKTPIYNKINSVVLYHFINTVAFFIERVFLMRSKILSVLLAVMIALSSLSCLSVVSFAAVIDSGVAVDEEGNLLGTIWEFDDTGILTIYMDYEDVPWDQYASQIKEVVIKAGVTTINNSTFAGYENLEKVTFEGMLATIGAGAFQNCDKLKAVILRSTTEIQNYAFYDCDALETVSIGGGLVTGLVGKNIFKSCDSLKSLTILNGANEIGEGMFEDCIALETISLPDSIEIIGRLAFENCGALKNIIIPDSTIEVGEYAFYDCSSVETAYIGHNVEMVGEYAFGNCTALASVEIKCAMPAISDGMFYGCSSLKGLTNLPEGIKTIGKNAFKDCAAFAEIVIPSTVTIIGDSAFDSTAITKIDIPVSVESIGDGAFTNCAALAAINVAAKNRFYASVDGVLYDAALKSVICCPAGKTGTVTITAGAESIGSDAFIGCTGITVIEIPDSVKAIASNAFNGCNDALKIKANCDSYAARYAKLYAIDTEITHSADAEWIVTVDPTCETAGAKEKQCSACGYVIESGIVDAIGHNYDEGVITTKPTCEADGVVTYTCQNDGCDSKYTVDIPATGHNYDNGTVTLEPTCENDGKKIFRCQNDGCYSYYEITLPATGHNMDDGTVKTEATCEADGEKIYKCKDETCGYVVKETIPALGHKYNAGDITLAPLCEIDGVKTYTCTRTDCGSVYMETIPATGHKYDKGVITKYPTVIAEGEITYTCENEWCTAENCANHTYKVAIPNTAFSGLKATNDGAYADENGDFHNLTWYITNTDDLVILADNTAEEWAPYRNTIKTVTITGEATTVENGSFAYMNALTDARILLSLGTIEAYAFQYCENLKNVETGSIREMQEFAFYSCKSLESVDIYGGLEEDNVGRNIFLDCSKLATVILRNGSIEIGEAMFKGCTALEEIVLPESLLVIGDSAFDGTSLKEIRIPTDVKEIQKGVFTNCTQLEAINVDSKNDFYFSKDGVLYDVSLASLIICPAGKTGEVEVWEGTSKIAEDAFIGCKNVTKVNIPNSVTTIADNAFNGCSADLVIACDCDSYAAEFATGRGIATELTHTGSQVWQITKEATCTEDGSRALVCSNCEYSYETETIVAFGHKYDKGVVTEEATCEVDGEKLFTCQNGCGDTYTEVIPAIGHDYDEGVVTKEPTCEDDGVKTFTCKNDCGSTYTEAIPAIGHSYDEGVVTKEPTCEDDGVKTFTCKNDCGSTYTEAIPAIGHSYDAGVITKAPTLNEDGEKLFTCQNDGCGHTYTEAIPNVAFDNVLAINEGAYADKNGKIQNVTWYLTKSGELYVYADGTEAEWADYKASIKSAVIAKTVKTIAKNAFMNCTALESVALAEGVEVLGKNAFKGCKALTAIELPETLNKIGDSAFDGTSIKEIFIPADVDVVEKGAFTNCEKLTAINVDDKNDNYFSVSGVLYDVSLASLIICPAGKTGTVKVWNGTKTIAADAFIGCKNVTKVNIPNSVATIADNAFNGCSADLVIAGNCDSAAIAYATARGMKTSINHVASDVWKVTTEATCLKKGLKERVCSGCGYSYETADIAVLGHNYDNGVVTTKATCVADGVMTFTCTREGCSETYTETIKAFGHKYNDGVVTTKATCEADGVMTYTCTREGCSKTYTEAIAALGHSYDNGTVTKQATCTEDGKIVYKCTNEKCTKKTSKTIKKLGHSLDEGTVVEAATCGKVGNKVYKCTNDGCSYTENEEIPALSHSYKAKVVKKGSCISERVVDYTCEHCGDKYTKRSKGAHQLYSYNVKEEPTCTKDGKEGKLCALCHEYVGKVTVVPATGHIEGDWITDKKATVYGEGKKHKECTDCGKVLKTAKIAQLKCSKPEVNKISNTANGVKITWSKVTGADYYRVYRKTKNGDWKYLDSTSKTYFTDKTAKSGVKYYYAVRAKNEAGVSALSKTLSKYYLADTTLKAPTSTTSGVKLNWTKVAGAEGYIVYRKTANGSYSRLSVEKGISNLSFTDKTAKKGTEYTYTVKAYYGKTYSANSNTKTIVDKY